MTAKKDWSAHPIAVVQDSYSGTYSGGKWIAIARANDLKCGCALLADLIAAKTVQHEAIRPLRDSPWGNDLSAAGFWVCPPDYVAVGDTPDAAVEALLGKGWIR
jgi:hypothetical protein